MSKQVDKLFSDEWGADQPDDVHPVWEARTSLTTAQWQALHSADTTDFSNETDSTEQVEEARNVRSDD